MRNRLTFAIGSAALCASIAAGADTERSGRYFSKTEIVSRLPDRSLHRYTYADFCRRARALAEALLRSGLKKSDRVATLMWNHYAHLETYFGVPSAGGVLHTLNLRLHPDDITYIANHAGDRFLIVDDVLLPLLWIGGWLGRGFVWRGNHMRAMESRGAI